MTLQRLEELRTRADYTSRIATLCDLWMLEIPERADLQPGGEKHAQAGIIGKLGLEVMRDRDTVVSRVARAALPALLHAQAKAVQPGIGPTAAVLAAPGDFDITTPSLDAPFAAVVAGLLDVFAAQRAALEPAQ